VFKLRSKIGRFYPQTKLANFIDRLISPYSDVYLRDKQADMNFS